MSGFIFIRYMVRLTTASQIDMTAAIADLRSLLVHNDSMQSVVLETKVLLWQRQEVSVAWQPDRSAFAIQVAAQSEKTCQS